MKSTKKLEASQRRLKAARQARDEEICRASERGMTTREIATVVGLSHQRIAQILAERREP